MDIKKIDKFARTVTYTHQRTIVKMKNGKEHVGFFDKNTTTLNSMKSNKWNFNDFHFENEGEKLIELNGDDIVSIEIKSLI